MTDNQEKGAMQVDVQLVRDLAALLDDTNLTEIEVEDDLDFEAIRADTGNVTGMQATPFP